MSLEPETRQRGVALLAVLFALTLLMLLALPFAVSMGVGAEASARDVDQVVAEQGSASVRELLLSEAAMSHPSIDLTPMFDGLEEFPDHVDVPPAFAALQNDGRSLLGGEVVDLQRRLGLDSASPLLFANVLGTATRLTRDLAENATDIMLENAEALPESGYLWLSNEVVSYGQKRGNELQQVERGLFRDEGFADGKQAISEGSLVLDYRCVLAAAWPFLGRPEESRRQRHAFRNVGELLEISAAKIGTFTAAELDALDAVFSSRTMAVRAATWGCPQRLFASLTGGLSKLLVVRSALHLGAGSTVRIRDQRSGTVEYGLVMSAETQNGQSELVLPAVFALTLLMPVVQSFPAGDAVVEPLIPSPVNINTAPLEVLSAVVTQVGRAGRVEVHDANGRRSLAPKWMGHSDATALAEQIVQLRKVTNSPGQGPFESWKDLVARVFKPRFETANDAEKSLWVSLYRNLQTGRDSSMAMGTAPICFDSGPWVDYRVACGTQRSTMAAAVVGRSERTGSAVALPGFLVERRWATQEQFEEAFTLDRRAPYWLTDPINLGSLQPSSLGNDPASRHGPHIVPVAYPDLGLGEPRYGSQDEADSAFQPAPATAPSRAWGRVQGLAPAQFTSFAQELDVRGHDISRDGPYLMDNTAQIGGNTRQPSPKASGRHDRISFPFGDNNGFCNRFAIGCWFEPDSMNAATLFDYGDGDPDRNRLAVHLRDGNLVFEVLDQAGLDPNPSDTPAGVPRTASEWTLPLAELALPPKTPVHLNFSAASGRPSDLSFAVDGVTRGKAKFVTTLTAALPVFDPSLGNNNTTPGTRGNDSYIDLQVESTEGFPSVGCLRIGTELFEYSSIQGNTFRCQFADSLGGRGARQVGREHAPSIPIGPDGKPTIDINAPQFQGVNLDVFPEHPAGAEVELYGYSAVLSEDTPMMSGFTSLDSGIGGFAAARGFIQNGTPIVVQPPQGLAIPIGVGIEDTWTGDLELADPVPTGRNGQPKPAQASISDAFSTSGGYALLMQRGGNWTRNVPGQLTTSARFGGTELIRYGSRQGNKLKGVQRAQHLPGQDGQMNSDFYDGTAKRFICNWEDYPIGNGAYLDDIPVLILWVVPISISVQNTSTLWDPQVTGYTEWVQLYPKGGDVNDTEWVRYDCIADGKSLARGNRAAWERLRFELTQQTSIDSVDVGTGGPNINLPLTVEPPWGSVTATSGYIGYTPRVESDFPQIQRARYALRHRGDPMQDFFVSGSRAGGVNPHATSSHPQNNCTVMQVHRAQLAWSNFGAMTGRIGRHDRVAVVQGSTTGGTKPAMEWHSVNWSARRFDSDNLAQNQTPPERLGPWPFQLFAFTDEVKQLFFGPPAKTVLTEPRLYDRIVKFPSGELPSAYCEAASLGAGIGGVSPMTGIVDELEVSMQFTGVCVLDDICTADGKEFVVNPALTVNAAGPEWSQADVTALFPATGGLVLIDTEIVAYQSLADGRFTIATNGRGLLNTEPRAHDRGARVHFLAHRPAAILSSSVGSRDATLPVQAAGPLPAYGGTLLLGRELLHYTWMRSSGDGAAAQLEMPRWYPPGDPNNTAQSRGLFRGRYGTTTQGGSSGEPLIAMPFRYWDRYAEQSDDPELGYFQLTTNEAPVFFRSLRWREETQDAHVKVVCLVRTDSHTPWQAEIGSTPDLWQFRGGTVEDAAHKIGRHAARIEIRFATSYGAGAIDLATFAAHGWKTTARIEDVRLQYEGQTRILDELVTAR